MSLWDKPHDGSWMARPAGCTFTKEAAVRSFPGLCLSLDTRLPELPSSRPSLSLVSVPPPPLAPTEATSGRPPCLASVDMTRCHPRVLTQLRGALVPP